MTVMVMMIMMITRRLADFWSHPAVTPVTFWQILKLDLGHQMVAVMVINNLLQRPLFNVNRPSDSEIQLPMVKAMCVVKGRGDILPWNSKVKVMVKVKPIGYIWGLEFILYVCFSFLGNRTIFGWNIANSLFDLENSSSRSWPGSNLMVTFEA